MTKLALNDRLRKKLYNILYNNPADDPYAVARVLNLDMSTGQDYSALSVTSSSAVGLVKGHDGLWVPKPAGYLAGLEGARINGSTPAWDDGSGNALSGVRWTGPKAATTTINTYSKPTPGANGWTLSGATDGGSVPGPDGNATSAQRIVFSALSQQLYRTISGSTSTSIYCAVLIKGTAGNKINLSYGGFSDSVSWQFTLTGGWDKFSLLGAVSGTPNGVNLSLNTTSFAPQGGLNPTASQTIDVFMLQLSTAPDAYIPTTGTNLTRLAETVTDTVAALGAGFSIMGTLDLSSGLPSSTLDIITSGVDKIQINSTGKLIITDGTLTTTSTASLSATSGQKFGFSRTAAGSTLQIGATQEAGTAVDWTGDTVLTVGTNTPLQRWSVWSERALSAGEMSGYV